MNMQKVSSTFRNDVLAGQAAMITGGGTGIGRGITLALAAHGADIVLVSRNRENMEATAEQARALGVRAVVLEADVRERAAVDEAVSAALAELGRIDHLVNNAAGNFLVKAAELSVNGWKAVVDIVLNGTFNVSQAVHESMRAAGGGSILNITTTYVESGAPYMAHSGAAKAGVLNLTKSLAVEWGPMGIRVNAIAPGLVGDTEGSRRLAESIGLVEGYRRQVPLGRLVDTEDVAAAAVFLASPAASHVTGVEITVDGGASLGGHFKAIGDRIEAVAREGRG